MAGRIVIVAYRPKAGEEERLAGLIAGHLDVLRAEGLATDREAIVMQAADGTLVEVFEWASKAAIEAAHDSVAVTSMWGAFAEVCEFIPAGRVPELATLFSEFSPFKPTPQEQRTT